MVVVVTTLEVSIGGDHGVTLLSLIKRHDIGKKTATLNLETFVLVTNKHDRLVVVDTCDKAVIVSHAGEIACKLEHDGSRLGWVETADRSVHCHRLGVANRLAVDEVLDVDRIFIPHRRTAVDLSKLHVLGIVM